LEAESSKLKAEREKKSKDLKPLFDLIKSTI
jgi:hypothetical protein